MRIAVFSDIHGNLEAFIAVLKDIEASGADDMICLGDSVGYGPDPEDVTGMLIRYGIPSAKGNHDHAVIEPTFLSWFNVQARISIEKTIKMLSHRSMEYFRSLDTHIVMENCRFVHGFPPDDFTTYLFQVKKNRLITTFCAMREWICFLGHTHDLEMIEWADEAVKRLSLEEGKLTLSRCSKYLINIGSVGQPRDGDNRSKYVLFDTLSGDLELRCVPYDIESVVQKILDLGLPESHAWRLR
jgi:predicted phosphodiesterase